MGGWFRCLAMMAVFLALVIDPSAAEIQCNQAVSQVLPCELFLLSGASAPNTQCCSGIQSLGKIAGASQEDRKALCECFKGTFGSFPINFAKAQQLPHLCHVDLNITIDPNVDCNSI